MDAQVHILCSNCEKVLVELPKEKRNNDNVKNIENETHEGKGTNEDKTIEEEKEPSLNFKSMSPDEEESSFCEIKIDYSKKEHVPSNSRITEETISKMESADVRFGDATLKKFEPTMDKIRRMAGYYYMLLRILVNLLDIVTLPPLDKENVH